MATSTSSVLGTIPAARPSRWLKYSVRTVAVGAALTGLIGVLHMPFAAPLLRKITPALVCPVQHGTPEQVDRGHDLGAASIRVNASSAAPARPALGFALNESRKADLDAWASKNNVSCSSIGGNDTLQRCVEVPAAAVGEPDTLGPLEEVTFEFRKTGELVNVQTLRRHLPAVDAARVAAAIEKRDADTLGTPSKLAGEATAENLGKSFLRSFVAEHTFTDYRATVAATNLAHTGVMVREEYISLR